MLDRRVAAVLRVTGTESFRADYVRKQQMVRPWTLCTGLSRTGNARSAASHSLSILTAGPSRKLEKLGPMKSEEASQTFGLLLFAYIIFIMTS